MLKRELATTGTVRPLAMRGRRAVAKSTSDVRPMFRRAAAGLVCRYELDLSNVFRPYGRLGVGDPWVAPYKATGYRAPTTGLRCYFGATTGLLQAFHSTHAPTGRRSDTRPRR